MTAPVRCGVYNVIFSAKTSSQLCRVMIKLSSFLRQVKVAKVWRSRDAFLLWRAKESRLIVWPYCCGRRSSIVHILKRPSRGRVCRFTLRAAQFAPIQQVGPSVFSFAARPKGYQPSALPSTCRSPKYRMRRLTAHRQRPCRGASVGLCLTRNSFSFDPLTRSTRT